MASAGRHEKGYDLTERLFGMFREKFPDLPLSGPERAGKDIVLGDVFLNYPKPGRPVGFIIRDAAKGDVLAVGLARYDGDRGGAQEDDRTGGYSNCADEVLAYARKHGLRTKIIFINDGPGLLLGSMWNDYAALERGHKGRILVATLRVVRGFSTSRRVASPAVQCETVPFGPRAAISSAGSLIRNGGEVARIWARVRSTFTRNPR